MLLLARFDEGLICAGDVHKDRDRISTIRYDSGASGSALGISRSRLGDHGQTDWRHFDRACPRGGIDDELGEAHKLAAGFIDSRQSQGTCPRSCFYIEQRARGRWTVIFLVRQSFGLVLQAAEVIRIVVRYTAAFVFPANM